MSFTLISLECEAGTVTLENMIFRRVLSLSLAVFAFSFSSHAQNEPRQIGFGAQEKNYQPIEGSQIFKRSFEFKDQSATAFVVDRLVSLEKQIRKEGAVTEEALQKQDKQIREAVSAVLDLESIGRYALSMHWDAVAAQEGGKALLENYMKVFKNLVEENYLERAREYLSGNHEIRFSREFETEERDEKFTVVEGSIKQPDIDLILQFYVQKEGDNYQVHDIRLDETSLRGTYRGSFNRTVGKRLRAAQDKEQGRKEGVSELVDLMNSRLAERQGENGNSRL